MDELIARCGPDALVRVVIKRITCSKCGKPVDVQVGPETSG
jgi:ribosomal protein S27AE